MLSMFQPFHTHMALAVQLLALAAGYFIFCRACEETSCATTSCCRWAGKVVGGVILLLTTLSIVCTLYISIRSCKDKEFCTKHFWRHPHHQMAPSMPEQQ